MPVSEEIAFENGKDVKFYPNTDINVWLRSCEKEEPAPVQGTLTGTLPPWLKGCLLRNGPGSFKVAEGKDNFKHLFDSSALLHRFCIDNGNVTYQRRYLQTKAFKKNHAAERIVVTEFGTKAVPDPCQSIFQTVAAIFQPGEAISDNAMISVYPFGDEFYAFTESPIVHRIDPRTLETLDRVNVADHVSIVNHTSHPLVMQDQSIFNVGLSVTATGPRYQIINFPNSEATGKKGKMINTALQAGSVATRWPFYPSYMHSFCVTENYFVIVEQPLTISVPAMVKNSILGEPMIANFRWFPNEKTQFYLISRKDGTLKFTFKTEAFFYLHTINAYEEDNYCIVDICCYQDPAMIDCMYYDSMQGAQTNPDYAALFRGRPKRFKLPLKHAEKVSNEVEVEVLSNFGCETPQINSEMCQGKPYRYFYAISSDVDLDNPGTIIKVDVDERSAITWCEDNVYPSEPIFVPAPEAQSEDDGVILSAIVWGGSDLENHAALLVLDAKTMTEIARCTFQTGGPVPKCLHGWFAKDIV